MIFGIGGKKGSGKDTLADLFVENGFEKVNFADSLKEICSEVFSHPIQEYYSRQKDLAYSAPLFLQKSHVLHFLDKLSRIVPISAGVDEICISKHEGTSFDSHRKLLQYMGTSVARGDIDDKIWIKEFLNRIEGKNRIVCADARFSNERRLIKSINGKNILVKRPIQNEDSHVSENDLGEDTDYDIIFNNIGTLSEFKCDFSMWKSLVLRNMEFYET